MSSITKFLPTWTPYLAAFRGALAPKASNPVTIEPKAIYLPPAKPIAPELSYALARPVTSSVTLHGAAPVTTAFAAATRAAYAPPVLRTSMRGFYAVRGPAREVSIFGPQGKAMYSFHGVPNGQGATCNFYAARTPEGGRIGVLEYRIGANVITAGPNARAIMNVEALEHQIRVTRLACPQLEMSEPVVVDDLVYVSVKLMDASVEVLLGLIDRPNIVSKAAYLALVRCCMRQVLGTMIHAANQGIYHRDIKPANILMNAQGLFLTTDWGLAYSKEQESNFIGEGTPGYAPPEHATGAPVDVRGDMFSLGVTLGELLGANVRDLPAAQVDKSTGTCGGLNPDDLLQTWCETRTNEKGQVDWRHVEDQADNRCEEILLRKIDRFALDARAGDAALTDYLFAHLMRFNLGDRHMPAAMLAWLDRHYPHPDQDLADARSLLSSLTQGA